MQIFLDIDGVLADFYQAVADLFRLSVDDLVSETAPADYNIENALQRALLHYESVNFRYKQDNLNFHDRSKEGIRKEMWSKITRGGIEFWQNIKLYPWAAALRRLCIEYSSQDEVIFATSPAMCGESSAGKVRWIQQFAGYDCRNYLITPGNKHLLAKNKGCVLIDDSDIGVEMFTRFGGSAILFPQPWNQNYGKAESSESRLRYVDEQLEILKHTLPAF